MRDFERDIIPMCRDEGMGLCPYGTLNQGRFQTEEGFKEREKSNPGRKFIPLPAEDKQVSRVLEKISKEKELSLLNIALAYIFYKAPYVFPIVGARKVDHISGNISALRLALSIDEIEEIESAYEFDHGFPHTFLSGSLFDHSQPRAANGPEDVSHVKQLGQFGWVEGPKPIRPTQ